MKPIIKYILFFFMLFFVCCNSEELLQEQEVSTAIRFTSQYIDISTKTPGAISGNILPENSEISLFSLNHPIDIAPNHWEPELFNNTLGIADQKGDILYDNTYYFPTGEQIDFFALYPSISEIGSTYLNKKTIDVQLPADAADQYDLMYASLLDQSKKSSTLVFQFSHLLTQVTFHIIQGENTIIDLPLTKIEIIAPQRAQLNLWKGHLNIYSDELTTYTLSTNTPIENETRIPGQFLLFPEKATEFILTFGNDDSHIYHITPSEEPYYWDPGKNYQYNIVINKDITDATLPPADVPSTPEENPSVTPPVEETTPPADSTPTEDPGTTDAPSQPDYTPDNTPSDNGTSSPAGDATPDTGASTEPGDSSTGTSPVPSDDPADPSTPDTGTGEETLPNENTDSAGTDGTTETSPSDTPESTDNQIETKAGGTGYKANAHKPVIIRLLLN